MKFHVLVWGVLFVVLLAGRGASLAEQEVVGSVVAMSAARLVIEEDDGRRREFGVTARTLFFTSAGPAPVKRVLPHSRVRVVPRGGEAEAVVIVEAPR